MEITALCTIIAALRILPNRSQFFTYESLTLSCGQQENSSGWTLKRNTSQYINQECFNSKRTNKSWRFFDVLYQSDSGEYWCESAAGECSDPVSITVTRLAVILESPALPVTEGDDVTLRCRVENMSSSGLTVDFYKDGVLFRSSSTGSMTIHGVSAADGGLYRCTISGAGGSPQSWLTVRGGHRDSPNSPLLHIVLPVVVTGLSLGTLVLLCLWRSHRGKCDPDISYTEVTITQEVQPQRIRDLDTKRTFYSTVRVEHT